MASTRRWMCFAAFAAMAGCGGATVPDLGSGTLDGGSGNDASASDAGIDSPADDSGRNNDSGGGRDAAPDGGDSLCPPAPAQGSCPKNGLQCEYGNDPNPACNTVPICMNGTWSYPPRGNCVPTGSACPASYGSVPQGKDCTPELINCAYPNQGTCECARGGGIVQQPPTWWCQAATSACPVARPRIGSSCNDPGTNCDYGACTNGVAIQCKDGYWQVTHPPCPL